MAEDDNDLSSVETLQNKKSYWTKESNKSKPSSSKQSVKSVNLLKQIGLQAKNKRFRAIYEAEGVKYGEDATEDEIANRQEVATSLRNKRILEVLRIIKQARYVQLCFLIDATGSMGPHIDGVKHSIEKIVDYLLNHRENFQSIAEDIQLAIVAYRDYDDSKQFEELHFTNSIEKFEQFCQELKPDGGDDACEDVLGGLDHAIKLKWEQNYGTKVIFHMADYPGHGTDLHDVHERSYDNHLEGDPKGLKHTDLFRQIREKEIEYYFGKITDKTNVMIESFSKAYQEKIFQFNLSDVEKIFESVVSAVELSVSSAITKSTMVAAIKREVRPHTLDPKKPDWSTLAVYNGSFLSYSFPENIQNIVDDIPFGRQAPKSAKIKVADHPFDKGSERLAFYGLDLSTYVDTRKSKKKDSLEVKQKNEEIVLKEYLHIGPGMNTVKRYDLTNQMQTIASYLAQKFTNELKSKADIDRKIKFLKIRTLRIASETGYRFMSCENCYKTSDIFVRFTNNTSYSILESKAEKLGIPLEFVEILMAFSHWTYQATESKLMVVDLQGIVTTDDEGQKQVILTDPAIHCVDTTRYGPMNHGIIGMKNFFRQHICNFFCRSLDLLMPDLSKVGPSPES